MKNKNKGSFFSILSLSNLLGQSRFLNSLFCHPERREGSNLDSSQAQTDPCLPAGKASTTLRVNKRGSFTLIELLVVLALVAILSVVVIMALNPGELLKQARDSNRFSDLSTINTALNLFSADVSTGSMGTPTVVYVSIPDISSTCANLGLPTLPTGWQYNCVTTANLRKTDGTGWIPVNFQKISSNSPISQLPIDPINTTTSLNYYTYMSGGSWKLTAVSLESQKYIVQGNTDGGTAPASFEMGNNMNLGAGIFPNGWIRVPGNSTFGTSDFWVMKYEAKCADTTGPLGSAPYDTGYQTYNNSGYPCNTSGRYLTSTPAGYPIANIDQTTSHSYCQSIGAHLITNNEWQTIAWNAQSVSSNWSGSSVGSGYLGRGNSNGSAAQIASADDTNSTYLVTADFTHRRAHTLSNGQIIWDLAGNVWEWTNDTITNGNQPQPTGWREFPNITNWGTLSPTLAGPSNSAWTATQGIGRINSSYSAGGSTPYAFVRGGDWYYDTYAGVETLILSTGPTDTGGSIGFRCAR